MFCKSPLPPEIKDRKNLIMKIIPCYVRSQGYTESNITTQGMSEGTNQIKIEDKLWNKPIILFVIFLHLLFNDVWCFLSNFESSDKRIAQQIMLQ